MSTQELKTASSACADAAGILDDTRISSPLDEQGCVPAWALSALEALQSHGRQAYLVGGLVRDALLGRPSHDVDMTTDAPWEQVRDLFAAAGCPVVETGARHGTVTVFVEGNPIEVTTFRSDGTYSDGRHPDQVRFVSTVEEDLARRDFTVNAMAWNPRRGLVDPYGGRDDLAGGIIRAVGEPRLRFSEDGLRILRALRFASKLGFAIEPATLSALYACADELERISEERIAVEYDGIVCGAHAVDVLRTHVSLIERVAPEIAPMVGFDQRSKWHCYDVWEHCLHALELLEPDASSIVRHVTLLHDIGKPRCFTLDEAGHGHFYEHEEMGSRIARGLFRRLRWRSLDIDHACLLIRVHDHRIDPTTRGVRRMLARLSRAYAGSDAITEQLMEELLQIKRVDTLAHAPKAIESRMNELARVREQLAVVLEEGQAFRVRDLEIGGADVIAAGFPRGPEVGHELRTLLSRVVDGRVPNEREALLAELARDAQR